MRRLHRTTSIQDAHPPPQQARGVLLEGLRRRRESRDDNATADDRTRSVLAGRDAVAEAVAKVTRPAEPASRPSAANALLAFHSRPQTDFGLAGTCPTKTGFPTHRMYTRPH